MNQTAASPFGFPGSRSVAVSQTKLTAALLAIAALIWCIPAIAALVRQTWHTEAGSLAPFVLTLGGWTLFARWRQVRHLAEPATPAPSLVALLALLPLYWLAAALDAVALLALAAWAGCAIAFFLMNGWKVTRACVFPLLFLGLVVPLPYSLSLPLTASLASVTARLAAQLAQSVGLDVAFDRTALFVGPYELGVDNACAGVNSVLSLTAIGLLYAYWTKSRGWPRTMTIGILAGPVALAANVLRVVALLTLTRFAGPQSLDLWWHPLAGLLSFSISLGLLYALDVLVIRRSFPNCGYAS